MLDLKDVQHIAELARLGFTNKEIKNFQIELSSILGYVGKLKKVDIAGTEPTYHPLKIENAMRQDEARQEKHKLLSGFLNA
ncbi:MAG: Asp-tRNA(Asn)/Glu-tRNA(Gln) amidotransferase subunit GatC [Candidatus Nealsonbacteria bacterium]|nr:Asp-tRNA(Asn)/Glu-tRNA(Gln) amidotransferase subunit GatC [Candidatus Nealsonbacteria bacterium]